MINDRRLTRLILVRQYATVASAVVRTIYYLLIPFSSTIRNRISATNLMLFRLNIKQIAEYELTDLSSLDYPKVACVTEMNTTI